MRKAPELEVGRFVGTVLGRARIQLDELGGDVVESWRIRWQLRRLVKTVKKLERLRDRGIDLGSVSIKGVAPLVAEGLENPGAVALRAATRESGRPRELGHGLGDPQTVRIDYSADPSDAGPLLRAHVPLVLHGEAGRQISVAGLVDSGADRTCLPATVAEELGFDRSELHPIPLTGLTGDLPAFAAPAPIPAALLGQPTPHLLLTPLFVDDLTYPIWGSSDFLRGFERVSFDDRGVTLVLRQAADGA
jgi:hypothetical protein